MALELDEYLWRMMNEHMTQARQQETLRSSMTTLLVTLSGALVALVTFDRQLTPSDLPAACLQVFLGVFGVLFSAKHYERFNFHISRVRTFRAELEKRLAGVDWRELRAAADKYHDERFPQLVKWRQNRLWLVLHSVNGLVGLVLAVAIVWH
jgi:ABC-type bacteriocin/lantibiotic exporter with double-glycine peptidase domain